MMKTNEKEEKAHSKYYAFIAGIMIIKIILMGICSSDYQNKLFEPFVSDFVYQTVWNNKFVFDECIV